MKKNIVLISLLTFFSSVISENQFIIKKERKATNPRAVRQQSCELCVQIVQQSPGVLRQLVLLAERLLKHRHYAALQKALVMQESLINIQELLQQSIEYYWNNEKEGMWRCSSREQLNRLRSALQELQQMLVKIQSNSSAMQPTEKQFKASFVENQLHQYTQDLEGLLKALRVCASIK